ncbi:uracil-DNA glycosylase [Bacteriovorax sp. Seq25_V]|uniref:uracil-DNA glycosylase n=1 Tax=Bacteriovorax sp. Seq25_V TaxID=1201288 RepID=UPI00038A2428|nr:uracil-DNA glycosylase [Bacteriovorax sp. Seq25_V]EQC46774.1 uracil-DNA glycosylase [Bacteriovorax sp. Seq25_V]
MKKLLKKTQWFQYLKEETEKEYFTQLEAFVATKRKQGEVYPRESDVFKALELTNVQDVKVVILGQDPYHGEGQAHGLSFSVPNSVKIPPSLINIYKELNTDLGVEISKSGNLERWARQGVLLLNNTLTVDKASAGSHQKKGWENFTKRVIEVVNERCDHVVFILWGSPAQKKASFVDESKHLVIKSVHPSPLSSYRGFFGSKPFSQANTFLVNNGKAPINW